MTSSTDTDGLPAVLAGFDLTDHALFARAERGFPYDVFRRLRAAEPVFFHPPGGTADGEGFWVVSRHADIAAVASDPGTFSARGSGQRKGGGSHLDDMPMGGLAGVIVAMTDNPRHELLARLLSPGLTAQAASRIERELRACAGQVIDEALARGECDFATDICEPFAYLTIALLLGIPEADRPEVARWAHVSTGYLERRSGLPTPVSQATMQATQEYSERLIARKRDDPGDDLATLLARGELPAQSGEPPLTSHDRAANLLLLLLTGGEQPRNALACGILPLLQRPAQWEALRRNPHLLPGAREEMLRWAPPNPYNRRTATRDARIGSTDILPGQKVTLWWPSGNDDEEAFAEPRAFDIARSPNPHLTFGYGNHHCLGNAVGRLQFDWLAQELLARVERMEVTGPVTYQPSNKHTIVLDMPVQLTATK